ncbi:hypothetical protein CHRYSEO8AT_470188 [Chryseobacterium sp. 8AT]|nr:hypothetical protein CHRYSEO8AT_470188 [Chryseobacterium sp. 8AT]
MIGLINLIWVIMSNMPRKVITQSFDIKLAFHHKKQKKAGQKIYDIVSHFKMQM